ncbi:MAG: hypothetical protein DMG65_14830 [Candidatus Angelobacter sp. Gp1-AA117]|nr:MAG: hypothetical protein DMG65_14830 [Candidatus Angelobacter sp. Gp1-AA117]
MRSLQSFYSAIFGHVQENKVLRLRKTILCLILLMVAVSPLLQLNSFDKFPVATDDIEIQTIYCLLSLGMLLVVTVVLTLLPVLTLWKLLAPPVSTPLWCFLATDSYAEDESPPLFAVPLRI